MTRATVFGGARLVRGIPFVILASALVLAVAGTASADPGHGHEFAFGEPGNPKDAHRSIRVIAKDNSFSPKKFAVRAGETVRIRIINKGELAHDFTIGPSDVQKEHRAEMAEMMEKGMLGPEGMMPGAEHGHDDPNAVLVGPGKTKELVWTFAKAGELEFGCNIPGHYEDGMHGEFLVR